MSEQSDALTLAEMRRHLREQLPVLRERYGVRALWLFGSHVRGQQDQDSLNVCLRLTQVDRRRAQADVEPQEAGAQIQPR